MNTTTQKAPNRWLLLLVFSCLFMANARMNVNAQTEEPADRFQLEYLKVDFSTNNSYHSADSIYYVYDLTNNIVVATNAWIMDPYWITAYKDDWHTNSYSWAIDPGTGDPTNGTGNFTWHYVAWTNFSDAMNPVVVPEKTSNVTASVTTFSDVTVSPTGSSGWQGKVLGTNYSTRINFIPQGTNAGTNTIKRAYKVTAWVINEDTNEQVPFTNITVLGKKLDIDGIAHVVLDEASTNGATPSVIGAPNHYFNVTCTRIMVDLAPRFTGLLTQREVDGAGWQTNLYDAITNTVGTDALGAELPFVSVVNGTPPATWLRFAGQQETSATVPQGQDFTNGWKFQRDVECAMFNNTNGDGVTWGLYADTVKHFTPNALAQGGNDNGGVDTVGKDELPDVNWSIFSADSPAIRASVLDQQPVGTVLRYRLYAHEWLTWQGAVVSEVKRWNSWIEIRKYTDGSWEYVPGLNRIQPTNEGEEEEP